MPPPSDSGFGLTADNAFLADLDLVELACSSRAQNAYGRPVLTEAVGVERELVDEIEANLFDGEVIALMPGADAFAAVEMPSQTDSTRGGVILLHGRGFHADWPENIGPLRVGLSEAGWYTLSLQMPVLEKSAKYYDYIPILPEALPRIDAALTHLKAESISPVVLLAHSCGAHMAMLWMGK